MQIIFSDNEDKRAIKKTIECKQFEIDFLGKIIIDGEFRGYIDTSNNFIEFDDEDFFYLAIKETDDSTKV
jgi:hypothetical protein